MAVAGYVLLVLLFGLPILLADCRAGGDIARQCAAAQRMSQVYRAVALLIPVPAIWLRWRGSPKAVPLLLAGSPIPLIAAILFERLTR
ncbi:MAG: hypothetical protein QOJ27_1787 [Sphingomonadales bacterium]|nr:hypothetical protein [Sphingomonadales bacterium]